MSKQTAVEYLVDNIHYLHSTKWEEIVEQAKEMEKQQIMDAYYEGDIQLVNAEQYYNETFKG
jgi:hypothetical protein